MEAGAQRYEMIILQASDTFTDSLVLLLLEQIQLLAQMWQTQRSHTFSRQELV